MLFAALSVLTVAVLATNASAWTSEDLDPTERDYRSAFVYFAGAQYWRGEYVYPSYTSMPVDSSYRGYMSYDVSHLDDDTYIESASITVIARNTGSFTLEIRVVDRELHELDPQLAFETIYKGTSAGTISISTGLAYRTFTLDITGSALQALRDSIASDDEYLVMGFNHASLGWVDLFARYIDLSGTYHSTLTLEYDDEAPDVPTPLSLDPFITGDSVPVSWSPAFDNPSGGNRSEVTYQVGVYLPGAPADNPYHTSTWVDGTTWDLTGVADNATYTFRVRARDGSGFASEWSDPVNTTIDDSPPSVPTLLPQGEFHDGTIHFIHIHWTVSVDDGVGNITYTLQAVSNPWDGPPSTEKYTTQEAYYNVTGLEDDAEYHFRVRAEDGLGHLSEWSDKVSIFMDSGPPTVPVLWELSEFTQGNTTTISWHPSSDLGTGVFFYSLAVATTPDFSEGPHIGYFSISSFDTSVEVFDLKDGVTYYYRVRCTDHLDHYSDWSGTLSSIQDGSPPTAPILHPVPEFVPEEPLTFSWDPAVDRGVGVSHYELWYYMWGTPGSSPMVYSRDVLGQSITLTGLGEGHWDLGLMAVDRFGQIGPATLFNVTVDGTPPTAPVLTYGSEFSNGTSITLSWSPSTDESGIAGYRVSYHPEGYPAMAQHVETDDDRVTILGLEDGVTYWYSVRAYDGVGNHAEGERIAVTADDSPPLPPIMTSYPSTYFDGFDFQFEWSEALDLGVGGVEYNLYWDHEHDHSVVTVEESGWMTDMSYNITDLMEHVYHVWVVARDAFGHLSGSPDVMFGVSHTAPRVNIYLPNPGAILTGTVIVHGWYEDATGYSVQYRPETEDEWEYIVYWTEMLNPPHFYESWDTSSLMDGDCVIRVNLANRARIRIYDEVNVTLANAHLAVGPSDITFSDPAPATGAKVTVYVTVRNTGGSGARDVVVELYDDGELVGSREPGYLEAYSVNTYSFMMTVEDRHHLTARVWSDVYDTGMSDPPRELDALEEDEPVSVSSPIAWVSILAIVLSVIAIALNLVGRRAEEAPGSDEAELWVESKDEEG